VAKGLASRTLRRWEDGGKRHGFDMGVMGIYGGLLGLIGIDWD